MIVVFGSLNVDVMIAVDHLPLPATLRQNIEVHHYPAGHMMYDDPASLRALHDSVAKFIRATDNLAH